MKNLFWGFIFILIGVFWLLDNILNLNIMKSTSIYPVLIFITGLGFEIGYFTNRRHPGLLVPGGILCTIGLLLFYEIYTNWTYSGYTWPVYILAVAFGLFQLYIHSNKNRGLLIWVLILTCVSLLLFGIMILKKYFPQIGFEVFWGALFIFVGLIIIIASIGKKNAA